MAGLRAAAAPQQLGAAVPAGTQNVPKGFRFQGIFRLTLVIDHRIARVGLADQREPCKPPELAHKTRRHFVGSHAVKAHSTSCASDDSSVRMSVVVFESDCPIVSRVERRASTLFAVRKSSNCF